MKLLIVNADDFGYTHGVNKGIIKAHKEGIVTSTSLMVDGQVAEEARKLKNYPNLSVGLHFDISGEDIKADIINGILVPLSSPEKLKREFDRQVRKFKKIMDRLPDHLDSHKHSHLHEKVKPIFKEFSKKHHIPVRAYNRVNFIDSFFGWNKLLQVNFKRISTDSLLKILGSLKNGVNEIMCHPGVVDDELRKISKYSEERGVELKTLTDKRVIDHIMKSDIKLCGWKDLNSLRI